MNRLLCRLRDESYADDERLAEAAAGMALYRLVRRRILDDDAMTVYKAGDVSVSRTPQAMLEYARRVRDESLAAASELLLDDGFVFKQVGDGE